MKRKKRNWYPTFHVDADLLDALVQSSLIQHDIYGIKSYFSVWWGRIAASIIFCVIVGALIGGLSGMLWGVLAGMVMPLFLTYLSIFLSIPGSATSFCFQIQSLTPVTSTSSRQSKCHSH